jgi:hypothetical protein
MWNAPTRPSGKFPQHPVSLNVWVPLVTILASIVVVAFGVFLYLRKKRQEILSSEAPPPYSRNATLENDSVDHELRFVCLLLTLHIVIVTKVYRAGNMLDYLRGQRPYSLKERRHSF